MSISTLRSDKQHGQRGWRAVSAGRGGATTVMTKVRSEVRFELQRPVKNTMDLIIVDTSGRHKQEQSLFDEMQAIVDCSFRHG
jgi:hypothetical protein